MGDFDGVKDHGGGNEQFETGAVRESTIGRGRYDLIPAYSIKRLAQHYENGATKYADRNWEKGMKLSRFIDSAERHMNSFKDGDRTEDHLAAILWNVAGYMWTEREISEGRLPADLANVPWRRSTEK
jgi:cell division protein YceG involved in septum cleavage